MNKEEIVKLIEIKELQLKEITKQLTKEIDNLKCELQKTTKEDTKTSLTPAEKIDLYMEYFRGRDDVYPYLSIDKYNSSKKYYIPSCSNEWKKGVCNKTI